RRSTASFVACSPSIMATASPGTSSRVSMTMKTTPSRTGTASSSRRSANVSDPATPSRGEGSTPPGGRRSPYGGARGDDLHGVVDRDPDHLLRQEVLSLAVETLALALVQAAPRLLDERVDARVRVARGVPAAGRELPRMEERVEGGVRVGAARHPAEREEVEGERVAAELREGRGPLAPLHLRLDADVPQHRLHGFRDLA